MRPGALSLLALFVLAQGTLFAHQLLVPHQTCAEHGELIHAPVVVRASSGSDAPAWLVAPAAAEHGHDHCSAFHSRRQDLAAAVRTAAAISPSLTARVEPAVRAGFVVSRLERLRLAPKSSPPV
jgi:hypothetical protein